jgi:hypothetical protein
MYFYIFPGLASQMDTDNLYRVTGDLDKTCKVSNARQL